MPRLGGAPKHRHGRVIPYNGLSRTIVGAARLDYNLYNRYSAKKTRSSTKTVTKKRGNGKTRVAANASRSSGFFKKATKRNYRSYRSRYKASSNGVLATFETGGVAADVNAVYVGHCTCPPNRMVYMFYHAILKNLFGKMGVYPTNVTTKIPNLDEGDTVRISFRSNSEPASITQNLTYDIPGAGASPADIVETWYTNSQTFTNQVVFLETIYTPNSSGTGLLAWTRVMLQNAKMNIYSKSAFKLQNRSSAVVDESNRNSIDACPLYGKAYQGTGNGAQYLESEAGERPLICHTVYGVIARPASDVSSLQEPPIPQHFTNISKSSKAHIDPGQVKTDVLIYRATLSMYRLLPLMFGAGADLTYKKTNMGKFKIFGLEKMIHAEEEEPATEVAFEANLEMSAALIAGRPQPTARIFSHSFYNSA
uniref:Uncharacterized protein n=1 Tax=uncultured prokaryote TaxID=198431 RepID=A0A0H5Q5I9_9ZZZZ|nr:hypothetical protein [uncultured prokaryote]